jgi:hypothetical protein
MGPDPTAFQNAVGGHTGINRGINYNLVRMVIVASKEAPFFYPVRKGLTRRKYVELTLSLSLRRRPWSDSNARPAAYKLCNHPVS